eukprot:2642246-Rhodomonas_salina.1
MHWCHSPGTAVHNVSTRPHLGRIRVRYASCQIRVGTITSTFLGRYALCGATVGSSEVGADAGGTPARVRSVYHHMPGVSTRRGIMIRRAPVPSAGSRYAAREYQPRYHDTPGRDVTYAWHQHEPVSRVIVCFGLYIAQDSNALSSI